MMTSILSLDAAGTPHRWITVEDAVLYKAKNLVLWETGAEVFTLRGGTNAVTGLRSEMSVRSIVAITGSTFQSREFRTPMVDRESLFRRDRMICAYCGQFFRESALTADHVVPDSRGGAYTWENLVTACRACNGRKDNRRPEEAKMPLLYLPYAPNRNEVFLLTGRRTLADQMQWLSLGLPKHSRLRNLALQ
jgi:5-methylcytosine-specific restriction endonuclease McrA